MSSLEKTDTETVKKSICKFFILIFFFKIFPSDSYYKVWLEILIWTIFCWFYDGITLKSRHLI